MNQAETDRERILAAVIWGLLHSQHLARPGPRYSREYFEDGLSGGHYPHFAYYRPPEPGDLVLCQTSGFMPGCGHPWRVAWYVEHEPRGYGTATLREIGGQRLCNMTNEKCLPIVGINPMDLLEGEQHRFHLRVLRAFSRGDEYRYRFGRVEFPEPRLCRIWIREAFGGLGDEEGAESVPFFVEMPFSRRTTIKAILEALRAGGYGTRPFERRPKGHATAP